MHTAESIFSNFVIEYLRKIETKFENILAQMGSSHEKNWRSKISWHTPFKEFYNVENCEKENLDFSHQLMIHNNSPQSLSRIYVLYMDETVFVRFMHR